MLKIAKTIIIAIVCIGLGAAGLPRILPASPPSRDPLYNVELPPVQYDYEPQMIVLEIGTDYIGIDRTCRKFGIRHKNRLEGCALTIQIYHPVCVIIVPRGVPESFISVIRRHEKGHCNGWQH